MENDGSLSRVVRSLENLHLSSAWRNAGVRIGLLEHTVNGERVKILLIEDDSGDAFLIQEMLAGVTDAIFEQQWCRTLSSGIE
jgi:hypothetical protein